MQEQRRYTRLPFATECAIIADGRRFPTSLIDISLKGALVERPAGWQGEPGGPCELHIRLGGAPVRLAMAVEVAHGGPGTLGLRCVAIDLDSITHLRKLLELNFGDPTLVERELTLLG